MSDRAVPTAAPSGRASPLALLRRHGVLAAFVLLILINLAITPNFATLQTLNINLTQAATVVIVAVGMTLVIASGGINLSVGSLMAIAGALAPLIFLGKLVPGLPVAAGVALAIVAALAVTTALGAFNGWLIGRYRVQPIVATLVLFIAGRGIAQVMTNGNLQSFRVPEYQWIGLGRIAGVPVQVLVALTVALGAHWLLRRTLFGQQLLAVGGNERAAWLSGVPTRAVKVRVYALSGLLAGIAGLLVIAINSASDANLVGRNMELDAIAAVAVGGTLLSGGRALIWGTVLGALTLQLVRYTLLANGVPDAAALVVKAGIILLAVWLQGRRA